jgi:hypothetical protein
VAWGKRNEREKYGFFYLNHGIWITNPPGEVERVFDRSNKAEEEMRGMGKRPSIERKQGEGIDRDEVRHPGNTSQRRPRHHSRKGARK